MGGRSFLTLLQPTSWGSLCHAPPSRFYVLGSLARGSRSSSASPNTFSPTISIHESFRGEPDPGSKIHGVSPGQIPPSKKTIKRCNKPDVGGPERD